MSTWLTGASQDSRVVAIAPMVIDMLNMPVTLEYQRELYGAFSAEIQDYVKIGIPQAAKSEFGSAIVQMIDPYSYRDKLTQPKMIFLATNDPYWTVDAIKQYYNGIPGYNLIHYAVNAGHVILYESQTGKYFCIDNILQLGVRYAYSCCAIAVWGYFIHIIEESNSVFI